MSPISSRLSIAFCSLATEHYTEGWEYKLAIQFWPLGGGSIDGVVKSLWATRCPDRWSVFANSSQPPLHCIVWGVYCKQSTGNSGISGGYLVFRKIWNIFGQFYPWGGLKWQLWHENIICQQCWLNTNCIKNLGVGVTGGWDMSF